MLNEHPSVKETVVIADEDIPDNKYLVAYIVLNVVEVSNLASVLRKFLKEKLPEYMGGSFIMNRDKWERLI